MNGLKILYVLFTLLFCGKLFAQDPLDYVVIGVIASNSTQQGIALVKHQSNGKVAAVKEGQPLASGQTLVFVSRKYVEFIAADNKRYKLKVGDKLASPVKQLYKTPVQSQFVDNLNEAEGIEKQGNVLKVTEQLKDSLIGDNLNKVLMQAAAIPHTENGKLVGFQLLEIDQGSIFDVAGFKNGDVITHINEQPINNAALAIRALNSLKQANEASFGYMRANEKHQLLVRID